MSGAVDNILDKLPRCVQQIQDKYKQGMRNWIVRHNLPLADLWDTAQDSDEASEFCEGGSSDCDIDENANVGQEHVTGGRGHLEYNEIREKDTQVWT